MDTALEAIRQWEEIEEEVKEEMDDWLVGLVENEDLTESIKNKVFKELGYEYHEEMPRTSMGEAEDEEIVYRRRWMVHKNEEFICGSKSLHEKVFGGDD